MLWECNVEKTLTKYQGLNIDIFGINHKISDYDAEELYQKLINITVIYCDLDETMNNFLKHHENNQRLPKLELELEDVMIDKIHPQVESLIKSILNELEKPDPNLAIASDKINEVEKIFELGGYEECLK